MKPRRAFPRSVLDVLHKGKILRIRAGDDGHRFIGIWVVVVDDRVFVRSWSVKPTGWYRTFVENPCGAIKVADREIAVRAVPARQKRLRDAIDQAYLDKYNGPGSIKYARDLGSAKSRATTLELVPGRV